MNQEITKIYFKAIIQGRLEFGSARSYDKVLNQFEQRAENQYRTDLIFTAEEIFNEEKLALEIPRWVGTSTEKRFKNTVALLDYCSQFAISGSLHAWMSDEGKIMHQRMMEPTSDKAAVRSFLKGRSLVRQEGKEEEAIAALDKAIEKYNRHAQAYERRAKVCFLMQNYHDAKRDYTKCISIDPSIPTAYYGRAKVHIHNGDWQEAVDDLDQTTRKTVALQTVYWKARRLKALCHLKLDQYKEAAFDLKLFTKRKFAPTNPINNFKRWAFFNYGLLLAREEKYAEAIQNYNQAMELEMKLYDDVETGEILRNRAIAKKKSGKNGHIKDLKEAIKLGDKQAKAVLDSFK